MIKVKANVLLYSGGRLTPFYSGYRPLFNFIPEMKISGQIILSDGEEFYPGQEGDVEIIFLNKRYLGSEFRIGTKFTFGEGLRILGSGYIKYIFLEELI